MFCQNCGNEIKEGAKFCPNCGTAVAAAPAEPVYEEPAPVYEEPAQSGEYYSAPAQEEPQYYQAEMPQPAPQGPAPNTTLWIILSVVELLCCCQIGGIVALVFSILGHTAAGKGNYAEAEQKLKIAKIAVIVGAVLGLIVSVIAFFSGFISELGNSYYYY